MTTHRRLEDAERKVMVIETALASLSDQIGQLKDSLKNMGAGGGQGPGSTGNDNFPYMTGGGGGAYYTGGGGWDWGDGVNHGPRGGLGAGSLWDESMAIPSGAPCRLYVYVYDGTSGAPIEGASVEVAITGGSTTRTTNASGYCSFDIANGISATITTSKAHYTTDTRTITISAGRGAVHRENVTLARGSPPGAGDPCTLDVYVEDSSHNPINDAPVKIIEGGVATVYHTGSDGHVSIGVTQGESLTIDVYPTGYNSQTRNVTISADWQGVDHETFTLDDAGLATTVLVELYDENNSPIAYSNQTGSWPCNFGKENIITCTSSSGETQSLTSTLDPYYMIFYNCHIGETLTFRFDGYNYYLASVTQWRIRHWQPSSGSITVTMAGMGVSIRPSHTSDTWENIVDDPYP